MQMSTATMMPANAGVTATKKRRADESNLSSDSERFTKRFNLLNLGGEPSGRLGSSNYYIPVSKPPSPSVTPTKSPHRGQAAVQLDNESMQLDDTRDRVYIHNLDDELADVESDEEKLIFLPDIEKRLSRIPQHILTGRRDNDSEGQELVLYDVPKSLTVDEGHDSVRKAILETRQRARQKAAEEARQLDMNCKYDQSGETESAETAHGYSAGYDMPQEDYGPDAMDMD